MSFDFPASPSAGQEFTPSGGPTYVWQSPRWLVKTMTSAVVVSDTAPASPFQGMLWWNSTNGNLYLYYMDGTSNQWVQINMVGA